MAEASVPYKGGQVKGTVVQALEAAESWNTYRLEDGTALKVKLIITDIVRLPTEFDEEGNPVYVVKSQKVFAVSAPESLRKKA